MSKRSHTGEKDLFRDLAQIRPFMSSLGSSSLTGLIQPVTNTRDAAYGAIGDDLADDTTPLTNAFAAAAAVDYPTIYIYGICRYNSASNLALADGMKITGAAGVSGIRFTGTVEGLTAATAMRVTLDEVSMYG